MNHEAHHHEKAALGMWPPISRVAEPWIGGLVSMLAAFATTALAAGHPWRVWVPLIFTGMIFLIALLFGFRAGLLGTVLAALVFAVFLFPPTGRINVADPAARTNLGWMMLTGIAFSFLFAPSGSRFRHR
jgi:K+-sensing histidine kinase KdpD